MSRTLAFSALLLLLGVATSGCAEPQHCVSLVKKLCNAAGEDACALIEANPPRDEAACQATLGDQRALNIQLDALLAAAAAKALDPAPTKP